MSSNLIIGITQRVYKEKSYNEVRDALDHKLVDWVVEAGFIPVPIPNSLVNLNYPSSKQPILNDWICQLKIDAIILSGGNNIGEVKKRDITENFLLRWAEKNETPVFGICRGMQMMGVYAGGELIKIDGHVNTLHQLKIVGNNNPPPKVVNSFHNEALVRCPSAFSTLAKTEDGCIESISHKNLSWEACMWHPERESVFFKSDIDRFRKLVLNEKK